VGSPSKFHDEPGNLKLALTRGSVAAAAGAGAILGIPGPFDLLALGRMASSAYSALA